MGSPNYARYVVSENPDARVLTWLWMYLKKAYQNVNVGAYGHPNMAKNVQDALDAIGNITKDQIEQQIQANFVIPPLFFWITNDRDQLEWLYAQLKNATLTLNQIWPAEQIDRNIVIGLFDLLNSTTVIHLDWDARNAHTRKSLGEKKVAIAHLKKQWELLSQPKLLLEWLDNSEEPERIDAGWQVFRKQFPHLASEFAKFENFSEVVDTFDRLNIPHSDRIHFLTATKKQHSRNRSKEKNKGKKGQCNLEISLAAIKRLKMLAKKHEMSQATVMEILLLKESEKGSYIPERLRQTQDDN